MEGGLYLGQFFAKNGHFQIKPPGLYVEKYGKCDYQKTSTTAERASNSNNKKSEKSFKKKTKINHA